MPEVSNARRLIKIRELLFTYTDEDHPLTLSEINQQLELRYDSEFVAHNNTIRSLIKDLQLSGFPIEEQVGKNKTVSYYHQYRKFEIHELRMLIDAVASAKFITHYETKRLIHKIKTLTSNHLAKKLQNQITVASDIKAQNSEVRYYIDMIHTSINERKKLTFQYGNFNVHKEFVLRHDGKIYCVIPLGLVWNNDYYYLVAKENDDAEIKHYRVDRMRSVNITEVSYFPPDFIIAEHMKESFNMYTGEAHYIEIQFDNHLINVVIDRFGKDIHIRKVNDQSFSITVKAAESEGLIRWLLTWGSDAKVIAPPTLVDKMRDEAKKMFEQYTVGS